MDPAGLSIHHYRFRSELGRLGDMLGRKKIYGFLRWLNYYGLSGSTAPIYTQWAESPEVFIKAFQRSWLIIAGLTALAVVTSGMRGVDKRTQNVI